MNWFKNLFHKREPDQAILVSRNDVRSESVECIYCRLVFPNGENEELADQHPDCFKIDNNFKWYGFREL